MEKQLLISSNRNVENVNENGFSVSQICMIVIYKGVNVNKPLVLCCQKNVFWITSAKWQIYVNSFVVCQLRLPQANLRLPVLMITLKVKICSSERKKCFHQYMHNKVSPGYMSFRQVCSALNIFCVNGSDSIQLSTVIQQILVQMCRSDIFAKLLVFIFTIFFISVLSLVGY